MAGFGDELRKAREDAGLSQRALGDLLHVTGSAIGDYERETTIPGRAKVAKLEEALGLPRGHLASLLGEEPSLAEQVRQLNQRIAKLEELVSRLLS